MGRGMRAGSRRWRRDERKKKKMARGGMTVGIGEDYRR